MASTLKKSAATLKQIAAGGSPEPEHAAELEERAARPAKKPKPGKTILIGAHFDPSVRRSLALLQADPRNGGKKINHLLAEALNDLFAKYGVPQTAMIGRED